LSSTAAPLEIAESELAAERHEGFLTQLACENRRQPREPRVRRPRILIWAEVALLLRVG